MTEHKTITNFFDETPITKKHLKIISIIAFAMVFEQADNYNFSFVAPTLVQYWDLSVQQIGYINSMFAVGMLLGTFFFGLCSDRFGRKKTLIVAAIVFSISSLLNGVAPNVEIFTLMRFLTGIGISGVLVVAPSYMMEMLPSSQRGRIFGLATGFGFIGIPGIAVLCNILLPMGDDHWRLIYVIGASGLLIAIFGAAWLKESPRWLVSKGKVREAEHIVEEIAGKGYKSDLSKVVVSEEKIPLQYVIREMFGKKYLKNTLVLLTAFCVLFPGGLIFVNFASTILVDRGFSVAQGLKLSSLMSIGMIAGPFVASVVAEWGGRKIPIAVASLGLSACSLVYAFLNDFPMICFVAIIFAMFTQVTTVLANAYASEMYPTKIRNAAAGLVNSIGRVCNIVLMSVFPAIYTQTGFRGVYLFLAVFFMITVIGVGVFGKRTSGVSLEELNE